MNSILKNILGFIYLLIIVSLIFILGYFLGISKSVITSSYITALVFIIAGYIVSLRQKSKYGKVTTPILKGNQLAYIKKQIDINIKTSFPCNEHKKTKVIKLKNLKNKIENEIPLDDNEIKELNNMV